MILSFFRNIFFKKRFGYLPSPRDDRDDAYRVGVPSYVLPPSFFLDYAFFVRDQSLTSSCVSQSLVAVMECAASRDSVNYNNDLPLSPHFSYWVSRQKEYSNFYPDDSGLIVRDALKAALDVGVAPEASCPFRPYKINATPDNIAFSFARISRLKSYNRCFTTEEVKASLVDGVAVLLALEVTDNFVACRSHRLNGVVKRSVGGHAMVVVAYDDSYSNLDGSTGAFRILNSWGKSWGDGGYCWLPYSYVSSQWREAWSVNLSTS